MTIATPKEFRQLQEAFNVGASDSAMLFRDNKIVRSSLSSVAPTVRRLNLPSTITITTDTTLGTVGQIVLVDASSGLVQVTMPSLTDAAKETFSIVKTDSSSNIVRIIGTVNGQTNADIGVKDTTLTLYATSTDWRLV